MSPAKKVTKKKVVVKKKKPMTERQFRERVIEQGDEAYSQRALILLQLHYINQKLAELLEKVDAPESSQAGARIEVRGPVSDR